PHAGETPAVRRVLSLPAGLLDLGFEIHSELSRAGLVKGFDPAEGFIQDPELVLRPVRLARDRAQLAIVIGGPRWADLVRQASVHGQAHRRYACFFDDASNDTQR